MSTKTNTCIVTLGYNMYLMSTEDAVAVMTAMANAEAIDREYDSAVSAYRYKAKAAKDTPDVTLQACPPATLAQVAMSRA